MWTNKMKGDDGLLKVTNLSKRYGQKQAIDGISFSITCGHTLALMGPNGAGKSTLIKALAGLIRPDSGKILWNGRPLHDTPGEIAYLPQRSDVDWSFPITVRALVEMGRYPSLGLWKKFGRHDRDIVEKSLHVLGMESLADRQISELSGGQQQRAFLARALAQEAHVLLLDEPFTGLDAPASQSLGKLLDSLAAEGRLVGGNLGLLDELKGTPYFPDIRDSVLFLEHCAEHEVWTFNRNLQALCLHPDFASVRAVVFGRFEPENQMNRPLLERILGAKKELAGKPVIANVDFGHTTPIVTFPVGGRCRIEDGRIELTAF